MLPDLLIPVIIAGPLAPFFLNSQHCSKRGSVCAAVEKVGETRGLMSRTKMGLFVHRMSAPSHKGLCALQKVTLGGPSEA